MENSGENSIIELSSDDENSIIELSSDDDNFDSTPQAEPSTINNLNDDCLFEVFRYLPLYDRVQIERVCKRWRSVAKDSWKSYKKLNSDEIFSKDKSRISNKKNEYKIFVFEQILKRCSTVLSHVILSKSWSNTFVLSILSQYCTNLLSFTITSHDILSSVTNDDNLIFKIYDDHDLSMIFIANKNLRYIKVTGSPYFTGECLMSLTKESVETIILYSCNNLKFKYLSNALVNFEKLLVVDVNCYKKKTALLSLPNNLIELRIPNLYGNRIKATQNLHQLKLLDVSQSDVDDDFLFNLARNCSELSILILNRCKKITNRGIKIIGRFSKIEILSLKDNSSNITDEAFGYMPQLRMLNCLGCKKLRDSGMSKLIELCDTLEVLDLSYCKKISNELVKRAISATEVRGASKTVLELILFGTSVNPHDIQNTSPFLELILPNNRVEALVG